MMDVGVTPNDDLEATPALLSVACSDGALRWTPIIAVIFGVAPFPLWCIRAHAVLVTAHERAERQSALALASIARIVELDATLFACKPVTNADYTLETIMCAAPSLKASGRDHIWFGD